MRLIKAAYVRNRCGRVLQETVAVPVHSSYKQRVEVRKEWFSIFDLLICNFIKIEIRLTYFALKMLEQI